MKVQVTILPQATTVESLKGKTILDISKTHGLGVHFECDSKCTCGTCVVEICAGGENLSPMISQEQFHIERLRLSEGHRLACQARVLGDVSIVIPERR